jgi:hypothetical protein
MKKSILITSALALTIVSCKDKSKDQPIPGKPSLSSKQTMLIGKDWKIKSLFSDGKDITGVIPTCSMDDIIFHFNDAGKGYTDAGTVKCDASDPQRDNITWKLENNETRLITTGTEGKDTFEIRSVSASELQLETEEDIVTLKSQK